MPALIASLLLLIRRSNFGKLLVVFGMINSTPENNQIQDCDLVKLGEPG